MYIHKILNPEQEEVMFLAQQMSLSVSNRDVSNLSMEGAENVLCYILK